MAKRKRRETWGDLFDAWGSDAELARDLDIKVNTVQAWRSRDSVPGTKFLAIWISAQQRGISLTAEQLLFMASDTRVKIADPAPPPPQLELN